MTDRVRIKAGLGSKVPSLHCLSRELLLPWRVTLDSRGASGYIYETKGQHVLAARENVRKRIGGVRKR
jgi:hypothetical protein